MAVATRPARSARPSRRRRYVSVGAGGREADLEAIERQRASRRGSAPGREERDAQGGRRPRREAPALAAPARFEVPPAEESVEPALVEEAPEFGTANPDDLLAYRFVAGIVEELPDEELPETRDEIEEEAQDLNRLVETLGTPLFGSVPKALLARARGVIAKRQAAVSDLAHELRFELEDDDVGEEVAPGLFEMADGSLVDEQGVVYKDVTNDDADLGPVLVDDDGNRFTLDDEEGLIPLPAPERDERGRFVAQGSTESMVSESAGPQHEPESDEEPEAEPEENV